MVILGITGGIGSGKSTVTELLKLLNIPVYIADIESKKLTNTSPVIQEKLIGLFGKEIYKDGLLDKKMLASIIFSDDDKLKMVNQIIHPEVKKDFAAWVKRHSCYNIVAHETAILFESGENELMDKIVTVYTPIETRIERVIKRDCVSRDMVIKRIDAQMSDEEKVKLSDYVIYNDENKSLIKQTIQMLDCLIID